MRNAESRFAGSPRRAGMRMGSIVLGMVVAASFLGASAHAAVIHKSAGAFNLPPSGGSPNAIAVDEETGSVYVARSNFPQAGNIDKFDAEGNPSSFSGLPGPNERQTIQWTSFITEDTFTLTCPNAETTAPIEWNGTASILLANIKAGLEAKCGGTFSVTGGTFSSTVIFEGAFASTDIPQMTCAVVTGSGSCAISNEVNGAPTTNQIDPPWGENQNYQIAIDNTGGTNQSIIYLSTLGGLTTCCNPEGPNPIGGIHVYLPSGQKVFPRFEGDPAPGGIYVRSQKDFGVRACGVAVDENGDLVVAHGESNTEFAYIDKLDIPGSWAANPEQEPTLLGTINPDSSNPCRTELDSSGTVYVKQGQSMTSTGAIRKWAPNFHDPSGTGRIPIELRDASTLVNEGPFAGFDLDGEDNQYGLRTSGPARIQKFDQNGSLIETIGAGELFTPRDVAINKKTGTMYVTDGGFGEAIDVHIYKAFTVPNSLTGQFSATGQTTGQLDGEVDLAEGGEEVTDCEFQYVADSKFKVSEWGEATTVPCAEGTTFTEDEEVSASIESLTMEELYYFRLVTENANGESNGTIKKFVPHAVIGLTTKAATNVAPRSATLNASFQGNNDATEYWFEYGNPNGLPGVYTKSTPVQTLNNPSGLEELSLPVTELELEATYHFRVVAKNSTGESKGFDQEFTTPPAVAGLTTKPATEINQESVTLNASFTGTGHNTHYYFEYGPTKEYGLVSDPEPGKEAGTTIGTTNVSTEISEFYGYTNYHYRVVASNQFGKSYGKDLTFTTEPAPKPTITGTAVSDLTPTTATFSAMVAPNRWDASWLFEWGETTEYGELTELEDVLIGDDLNSYQPIEATVDGLKPATFYHFRTVAFNFTGVINGPDLTFITPDLPKVESTDASGVGETTAHLSARVVPNSSPTDVHFEFGASTGYGNSTPASAIGSGTFAQESGADLTGLTPGTTYHYRVVGVNAFGTTYGGDQTFTTLGGGSRQVGPTEDCGRLSRLARKNSSAADRLRRKARKAAAKQRRKLRRRAAESVERARAFRKKAGECIRLREAGQ